MTLLQQFRAYFAANPTHEVPNLSPVIAATAAACEEAARQIADSSSASNNSNTDAGTAKSNLDAGIKEARRRLTGLREELHQLITEEDERWYAFGFDRPGDPETPEVPENLTAVPGAAGSHAVFIDWDDARRAASYRVTLTDPATRQVVATKIVEESEAHFENLPASTALQVEVTARNEDGGESQPTEAVAITVP